MLYQIKNRMFTRKVQIQDCLVWAAALSLAFSEIQY